jgi:hypothetical protein
MSAQSIIQQVRWQDLEVRSEVDVVFEIAKEKGWDDCEIFGYGSMVTQPRESTGWKLIPADLYDDRISAEGVERVRQIIDAGVRIQGIIIADDQRRTETPPAPSRPKVLPSMITKIQLIFDRALTGLRQVPARFGRALAELSRLPARLVRALATGLGRLLVGIGGVLLKIISKLVPVALIALAAYILIQFPLLLIIPGVMMLIGVSKASGTGVSYDPKLVVLVDDGTGGTAWISVLTWYD